MLTYCRFSSTPDQFSVCEGQPFQGLFCMLQLYAHSFIRLLDDLQRIETELRGWGTTIVRKSDHDLAMTEMSRLAELIDSAVPEDCKVLGLHSAEKQVRKVQEYLQRTSGNFSEFTELLKELRRRIVEDLEDRVFFHVYPHKIDQFFKRDENGQLTPRTAPDLFGQEITTRFPGTLYDVEEAAKCFVCSRYTACVFHLMRVMEVGLRALGQSLGDPSLDPSLNPTWERILKRCDTELQKSLRDRSAEWKTDERFFAEATANLRVVKDAWRNPTTHVEAKYDEERARDVWNAVLAFMRHLAIKLSE
jgi:hypothetical protein